MIDTKTQAFIKTTIRRFLPDPAYYIFVFGSRVGDHHHPYSDIDVGLTGDQPVPSDTMELIKEAFVESSLPYHVDVVDFIAASKEFSHIAGQSVVPV